MMQAANALHTTHRSTSARADECAHDAMQLRIALALAA
jgi:hypothetical protein